jgi:hypothetical protein
MDLRCKVFRASGAAELEAAVNRFLGEELDQSGPVQFEEITQSEGPAGVTLVLWYSLAHGLEEVLDDEAGDEEGFDEVTGKELA